MNTGLRNLIALQDLEQKIAELQKQKSEVPTKVQQSQEELERLKKAHSDRVEASQELTKRRRAHEGTVDLLRTKLSKLKDRARLQTPGIADTELGACSDGFLKAGPFRQRRCEAGHEGVA